MAVGAALCGSAVFGHGRQIRWQQITQQRYSFAQTARLWHGFERGNLGAMVVGSQGGRGRPCAHQYRPVADQYTDARASNGWPGTARTSRPDPMCGAGRDRPSDLAAASTTPGSRHADMIRPRDKVAGGVQTDRLVRYAKVVFRDFLLDWRFGVNHIDPPR
jgi:hypothetical protein